MREANERTTSWIRPDNVRQAGLHCMSPDARPGFRFNFLLPGCAAPLYKAWGPHAHAMVRNSNRRRLVASLDLGPWLALPDVAAY